MSAFLMEEQSLSNIANWFYFENDTHGTYKQCKEKIFKLFPQYKEEEFLNNWDEFFSEELYKLNCYSLNQRYGDKMGDFKDFEYKESQQITKIQLLKSVACWLYQSCEGNAEEKPLYKMMEEIRRILESSIINGLDEYERADWK